MCTTYSRSGGVASSPDSLLLPATLNTLFLISLPLFLYMFYLSASIHYGCQELVKIVEDK